MKILIILLSIFLLISCQSEKHMDENQFWSIIEKSNQLSDSDNELFLEWIWNQLYNYSENEIIDFECILREKIEWADHFNVMISQKIITWYVSDDTYLYFIGWLIWKWKETYTNTINTPDFLSSIVNINTDEPYFEEILHISNAVYERKMWEEEASTAGRNICNRNTFDYNNQLWMNTKWKDWEGDNELKLRFPKLSKIFENDINIDNITKEMMKYMTNEEIEDMWNWTLDVMNKYNEAEKRLKDEKK